MEYKINDVIADDGYVYCWINKGSFGLKQAEKLARNQLIQHLKNFGYAPDKYSPNIWGHVSRPTKFCLCVDNFGIKSYSKEDTKHLLDALRSKYKLSVDETGKDYCGLTLEWNYSQGWVDILMPKYLKKKTLEKLNHKAPKKEQHTPHRWERPHYGVIQQLTPKEDSIEYLSAQNATYVQKVVGSFLYYGRAMDPTILTAINKIGLQQAKPTMITKKKIIQLLDYLHTHPMQK